jgi:hypothetical protein
MIGPIARIFANYTGHFRVREAARAAQPTAGEFFLDTCSRNLQKQIAQFPFYFLLMSIVWY